LNIRDMLEELERLEKKVLDEKYSLELQLKDKEKSQEQNSSETDQLRGQIVTELRAASIESMLRKIRKNRVGLSRNTRASRRIRIMKSLMIPRILTETIEPITHDQSQTGNAVFESQESQSELVHQNSFPSNAQSSFMTNDQLQVEGEDWTREESLTANMTDTFAFGTSDNEAYDIKCEIPSEPEMVIDPLQLQLEDLGFPHQSDFVGQFSTKSEIDNLLVVNKSSYAKHTSATEAAEDSPRNRNFICGTCGVEFVSYNQLRIHDRIHFKKGVNRRPTVKNIHRKKEIHNTTNHNPSRRPKKCEECGKILSCNETWTNHVMSFHRGQYKFKCTRCNFGCQLKSDLQKHIKKHSAHKGEFKCSECNRGFKSKQGRSAHVLKCYQYSLVHSNDT